MFGVRRRAGLPRKNHLVTALEWECRRRNRRTGADHDRVVCGSLHSFERLRLFERFDPLERCRLPIPRALARGAAGRDYAQYGDDNQEQNGCRVPVSGFQSRVFSLEPGNWKPETCEPCVRPYRWSSLESNSFSASTDCTAFPRIRSRTQSGYFDL
jgi:hypothetical protein